MTLVLGLAGAALIILLLVRAAMTPTMALLYSGLESSAANGVIEGLERQGVAYEVRGDAIYVPAGERDRARIRLAGDGLPAAGAAGYELLDSLSGFGTTSEMFDAAYWRAKEGELARTILSSQHVTRARVHIAQSRRRPFEPTAPVTASITVSTSSGALTRPQAEALRHLVASAVTGLSIHEVAVIDQERGVILKAGEGDNDAATADDAAAQSAALRANVMRLLEARVGPGAAIVEVAVDTARASETVRERILDPNSKTAVHTETEESSDASEGGADAVTVASNLPDGDVEGGGDSSTRRTSRTRERANFEMSETVRETVLPPGEVKRITVAVMVDGVRSVGDDGSPIWTPRPQQELDAMRALIESAIGYSEERGDQVTIESLEFSTIGSEGSDAGLDVGSYVAPHLGVIAQILALAIAAAVVGLMIVKPIFSGAGDAASQLAGGDASNVLLEGEALASGVAGEENGIGDGSIDANPVALAEDGGDGVPALAPPSDADMIDLAQSDEFGASHSMIMGAEGADQDLRMRVGAAISEQPERAAEILSEWLDSATPKDESGSATA